MFLYNPGKSYIYIFMPIVKKSRCFHNNRHRFNQTDKTSGLQRRRGFNTIAA
mgnify:CR=1 FL=1